ncbi:MAG: nicotinate phosphoribosyltransferase pncB2 [Betaproteobacteria bacterium]|nr:MAG: nicotinate phosphoribosyltransferase [Betaproteobacteria bacterium]
MALHEGLLTDLYEFAMARTYRVEGMAERAVFELFVRAQPGRNFLVAAGLEQALDYLERLRFDESDLAFLRRQTFGTPDFIDWLRSFRFEGDVDALPEGTVLFPNEPVLRVSAPLPQAQLVETRLLNLVHFQTLIASKAVRCVLAARGRALIDYGLRRAHGAEAGVLAARASWIAGFAGTATVEAGRAFGLPLYGTMAHAFVQAHGDETAAFLAFARANPGNAILLIDTYDTVAAARKVVAVARTLAAEGIALRAVRIDSGDLDALARAVRSVLDEGGLRETRIIASGGLDEDSIDALVRAGSPLDAFGVGSALACASDHPVLDCAYKLQSYAGGARRKRSTGKATWPGIKQVFRRAADDRYAGDTVALADEPIDGKPLLVPVMRAGHRVAPPESLDAIRARLRSEVDALPTALTQLAIAPPYPVEISPAIRALAAQLDAASR